MGEFERIGAHVDDVAARLLSVQPSAESYSAWVERTKQAERRSFSLEARIPSRVMDLWWSGQWRTTDASRRAIELIRAGVRTAILWGGTGTGKSCAAAQVLLEPCAIGPDGGHVFVGMWISAWDYADLYPRREEIDLIRDCQAASYLVVDDLGEEPERDSGRLARLITDRYDSSHQRTIITTNLDGRAIRDRYGRRVGARLKEIGGGIECKQVVRPGEVAK